MSKLHIDYLVAAAIGLPGNEKLRWRWSRDRRSTDYQEGEPWGPTATRTFLQAWVELDPHKRGQRLVRGERESDEELRLVSANAGPEIDTRSPDEVGMMLLEQNFQSVNHRYAETEKPEVYRYAPLVGVAPEPVKVLKALACYEYQSCEDPGWEESEAAHFCDSLRLAAIRRLPGYDKAPWGVDDVAQLRPEPRPEADPPLRALLDASASVYVLAGSAADERKRAVQVRALRRLESAADAVRAMMRDNGFA